MWSTETNKSDSEEELLYLRVLAQIHDTALSCADIDTLLSRWCRTLSDLPAIRGVAILTTDSANILRYTHHHLSHEKFIRLEELYSLTETLQEKSPHLMKITEPGVYAAKLTARSNDFGLALIQVESNNSLSTQTLTMLSRILPHLALQASSYLQVFNNGKPTIPDRSADQAPENHSPAKDPIESPNLDQDYLNCLSHQLRTPLGALIQNLYDFRTTFGSNITIQARLDSLISQVRVCNTLARDFTYIDRILRGDVLRFQRTNLAELFVEAKTNFTFPLKSQQLHTQFHTSNIELLFSAHLCHPEAFSQAIHNLFDNAIKYSKPGTTIQVEAAQIDNEKCLLISNIGIPIPLNQQKRIFERGFRTSRAAAISDGTGLGLWIVKKVIDLHGGSASCSSQAAPNHPPMAINRFKLSFPNP